MKPRFGLALLRLFAVQGSWNYERMIGLGAGVAEEPLLRDLQSEGNGAAYRGAVARGAHFFNSHPYLAGLAVGATARAELEHAPPEQIERLRAALTLAKDEINWWADEHGCCEGSRDEVITAIDAALGDEQKEKDPNRYDPPLEGHCGSS